MPLQVDILCDRMVHTRRELIRAYRPATFQRGDLLGSPSADEVMGGSEEGNALRYCVR